MDRSIAKQHSTMDRNMIDTWKAEEKHLSDNLYQKITVLNLLYTPSDDFRAVFKNDMFVKPNPKAFYIVMHYLFNIYDSSEFKKRFYWPIVDKKSEANFRSTMVQYLNYISEKHNLNWTNIKSYLFITPGGMKFLLFLKNFVDFIVRDLIKQREKYLNIEPNTRKEMDFDINKTKLEFKCLKHNAKGYVNQIEFVIKIYKDKTDLLRKTLTELSEMTKVPIQRLLDKTFIEDFENSNNLFYKNNFKNHINTIKALEEPLKNLKDTIDSHQIQGTSVSYNKESAKKSLKTIQSVYHEANLIEFHSNNEPELEPLIRIFNIIYPEIKSNLEILNEKPTDNIKFEEKELHKLVVDLNQLENQVTTFIRKNDSSSNHTSQKTPMRTLEIENKDFISKFVNTPPIKFDLQESRANTRLPLLDDYVARSSDDSYSKNMQNTTYQPKSNKKGDTMCSVNQTIYNKTKIIDPLKLLKSLHKDASRARCNSQNLSSLALKWKERESLLDDNNETFSLLDKKNNSVENSFLLSPKQHKLEITTACTSNTNSFISPKTNRNSMLSLKETSLSYQKKHHGIQKIQDASVNLLNLSSSPSGRLESLIDQKEFPKILLNDLTLNDSTISKNESFCCSSMLSNNSQILSPSIIVNRAQVDQENDANLANILKSMNIEDGFIIGVDTIFNISDSVIKNVPM